MPLNRVWFSWSLFCILNREESFWTVSLKKSVKVGDSTWPTYERYQQDISKKKILFDSAGLINTYVL